MLFNSATFIVFFLIFFMLYVATRSRLRLQNALILVGSYVFYGAWDERFLVLLILSTTSDYVAAIGASGRSIHRRELARLMGFLAVGSIIAVAPTLPESSWILAWVLAFALAVLGFVAILSRLELTLRRRAYVWLSMVTNLGILGVFKYFNFFADSLVGLAGGVGWHLDAVTINVILPVGISFFTFQTMSYTIDVYRGRIEPTHQLLELAAYVAFFPQLVAGPIERGTRLLPQFFRRRKIELEAIQSGAVLFFWGLFKKIVIADNLAPIADRVFADPGTFAGGDLLVALLAFTFQIYCDFSGYSDMARGLARMLGFDVMLNFNLPYFSRTPSEFWERWHISLSSWLRDYLYIPLGGNRYGSVNTYRNLVLTMLLGGLWHGAAWTFVCWGAYQGLILVLYRILRVDSWLEQQPNEGPAALFRDSFMVFTMFALVVFGWLFFRAESLSVVWAFVGGFAAAPTFVSSLWAEFFRIIWPLLLVQAIQIMQGELEIYWGLPRFAKLNMVLLVICGFMFVSASGGQPFIYFDF
jgi:D-alanyl-lipoteichoic acid acyltransferase DltB (MBOAT superfamily)